MVSRGTHVSLSVVLLFAVVALAALPLCTRAARLVQPDGEILTESLDSHHDHEEPKPHWHNLFNVEFDETSIILFKRKTEGRWWYDAANGNEVIYRKDGRGDRYCGSIHALEETPCKQVVTEGNRYIMFPEKDECCLCCSSSEGCGVLSPDWLEDAHYLGTEEKNGKQAYKWVKKGLQPNYYWATADENQIPIELDQWPNNYQSFRTHTFSTEAIDEEQLKIPENCKDKCPLTSLCTLV